METKKTLHICMGSACHQQGVYDVLPRLQSLIKDHQLEDRLELKGAFCLGACARGVVLKLDNTFITEVNAENVESKFVFEVLNRLEGTVNG